ncbi:MAG: hypothetical protein HQK62_07475 [Desulfamplus sp.]|nr:hypothetical protein [Desulfamplus sp.]
MMKDSEEKLKNLTSKESLKHSEAPEVNPYSSAIMLTPSEIESLRKDGKEADRISRAYFTAKYGNMNQK